MADSNSDSQKVCDISPHDKAILNRIFNPGLPFSDICEEEEKSSLHDGMIYNSMHEII